MPTDRHETTTKKNTDKKNQQNLRPKREVKQKKNTDNGPFKLPEFCVSKKTALFYCETAKKQNNKKKTFAKNQFGACFRLLDATGRKVSRKEEG